jgi:hypothetical protein
VAPAKQLPEKVSFENCATSTRSARSNLLVNSLKISHPSFAYSKREETVSKRLT